jgi:hypothetical protein
MSGDSARAQILSPAKALWRQRDFIKSLKPRLAALSAAIGEPSDFSLYQWVQILAFTLEFKPELIIELGRRFGNSTCCFLEAANRLGEAQRCRVISLDIKDEWSKSRPRIAELVPSEWFAPAQIELNDILDYDFASAIGPAQSCLVFWDAHGFEIAECVLGGILPQLKNRRHVVLMHDISDARFEVSSPEYGNSALWRGCDAAAEYMWLGDRVSSVAQLVSAVDFTTRNQLPFHSAVESFRFELSEEQRAELASLLGDQSVASQAHWHWFSLSEAPGRITFPACSGKRNGCVENSEAGRLRAEKQQLLEAMAAMQESPGWRSLETLRRVRQRLAPPGSARRRLLDNLTNLLIGR